MTNGIVLLNLEDRNAANFDRILVPGSYDKAAGAAEAGAYVNVYKWQYQGFMMAASVCTAEDKGSYILLTDKLRSGNMYVYPDDTIYLEGSSEGIIEPLTAIANGTYLPQPGVSGFSPVTVNVPTPVTSYYNAMKLSLYTYGSGNIFWPEVSVYMAHAADNWLSTINYFMDFQGHISGSFSDTVRVKPLGVDSVMTLNMLRSGDETTYLRMVPGTESNWYYGTLSGQQIVNPSQMLSTVELEIPGSSSDPSINIVLWKEI